MDYEIKFVEASQIRIKELRFINSVRMHKGALLSFELHRDEGKHATMCARNKEYDNAIG